MKGIILEEAEAVVRVPPAHGRATRSGRSVWKTTSARVPPAARFDSGSPGSSQNTSRTFGTSGPWTGRTRTEPGKGRKPEPAVRLEVRMDTIPRGPAACQMRKKGTSTPRHSNRMQKYGGSFGGRPVETLLRDHLKKNESFVNEPEFFRACLELVGASLARNTWKRYNSALRLWNRFRKESGKSFVFLDYETWDTRFLVWGWRVRKLKVNTLKIYLSELKNLGNLATGLETMGWDLAKVLERGMTNLSQSQKKSSEPVYPLTIADF
jgi:hypothetical protein